MQKFSRRQMLGAAGISAASGLVIGGAGRRETSASPVQSGAQWTYARLDPRAVAETAYRIYPDGGCMYAMMGSVVAGLVDLVGEPYRSFPLAMMRYGASGLGGWGSLCGVVNGGAAVIGLFCSEPDKKQREELIAELCTWYESSQLPQYQPAGSAGGPEAKLSVAGSVLCHVSISRWCEASGCTAFSKEKKERCRRLAADGAAKVVEILNRKLAGLDPPASLSAEVKSCLDCHGEKDLADAMGKMSCTTCHKFDKRHP